MPKRKFQEESDIESGTDVETPGIAFKNSLDSDEDDDEAEEESYNVMHENDFEGMVILFFGPIIYENVFPLNLINLLTILLTRARRRTFSSGNRGWIHSI